MWRRGLLAAPAGLFTAATLLAGYLAFGPWTSLVFTVGFVGGFLLWLVAPQAAMFADIRWPYWLTLAAFILLHRVEEYVLRFQERLATITGHPVPSPSSPSVIVLLILSVAAWLSVPLVMKRSPELGRYLAWTFFASTGLTELAHFIFPLFEARPYSYFPGMASTLVLAPLAWWGMYRLWAARSS
jgi:hypothetical protein